MQKAYDGFLKYKIIRQNNQNAPVSMTLLAVAAVNTLRTSLWLPEGAPLKEVYRWYYTAQLIVARKFSPKFSAQLMPTLVHRNLTQVPEDKNMLLSMGGAARYKVSKRMGIVAETYYTPASQLSALYQSWILGVGVEIETGGHVYHLLFTNASGLTEHQIIGATTAPITQGVYAIRFGFNLSRVFTVYRPS